MIERLRNVNKFKKVITTVDKVKQRQYPTGGHVSLSDCFTFEDIDTDTEPPARRDARRRPAKAQRVCAREEDIRKIVGSTSFLTCADWPNS